MKAVKIVGLCGYAGVGKDTAARNMPGWKRFAFADRLKVDLLPLLLHVGCDLANPEHKERARGLLVAWGATARRFRPGYWVERLAEDIEEFARAPFISGQVVITDVRYPNEVFWILNQGGTVIKISRPGYGPKNEEEARSIAEIADHVSRGDCSIPAVRNVSTPEALGMKVLEVVG